MSKHKKSKTQTFNERTPFLLRNVVGAVWSTPSLEIAEATVIEIDHHLKLDGIKHGPAVSAHMFYSVQDGDESYIVLVGSGSMFNPNFTAVAGMCIKRRNGDRLPESDKTRELINTIYDQWRKDDKHNRKQVRLFVRTVHQRRNKLSI
ncbi:MAG: hypothetical protein HY617_02660 [Candidatus Sungbacteria bacterium]|nr:hypothetical protein [Candidatus Sungbacteria bacterium]